MSINNDDEFNRSGFQNNFSIYRNNFLISSSKNNNNFNTHNKLNDDSLESLDSFKFPKKNNEKKYDNRYLINNKSMIDLISNLNKKRENFYFNNYFEECTNVEEIPTFCYENDLNVKSFKNFITRKNETLENNYKNYLIYMKKHENKDSKNNKNQLILPYSMYMKKAIEIKNNQSSFLPKLRQKEISNLKMNFNRYDNQKNNNNNFQNSFNTSIRNKYNKYLMKKYLAEVNKNRQLLNNRNSLEIEKSIENKNNNNNNEILPPVTKSINNINKYFPLSNEISNPELYYRKCDKDFYIFRNQHKKFDDYNYKLILLHKTNRFLKKEPDVNPYNPKINYYKSGNSTLEHNVILRPNESYKNLKNTSFFF